MLRVRRGWILLLGLGAIAAADPCSRGARAPEHADPRDPETLRRSFDGGDVQAGAVLAWRLFHGKGLRRDVAQALAMWQRTADARHPRAMMRLAALWRRGLAGRRDLKAAREMLRSAAADGDALAWALLAEQALAPSALAAVDVSEAAHRAADGGCHRGALLCALLEERDDRRERQVFDVLAAMARQWPGGVEAESAYAAAVALERGWAGDPEPAVALVWYRRAAAAGSDEAMARLGWVYRSGMPSIGLQADAPQSLLWFESAAERGHPVAARVVARVYDEALGVNRDQQRAADWYRRAARAGDAEARRWMRRQGLEIETAF